MGGGQSIVSSYRGVYNLDPSLFPHKTNFETLCLRNSEVKSLYDVYHKIDNANNNAVEINAIFLALEIENEFIRKLFIYTSQLKQTEVISQTTVDESESGEIGSRQGSKLGSGMSKSAPSPSTSDSCTVSFDVFVYAVWTLCSLQPSFFELFVFDMYLTLNSPSNDEEEDCEQDSLSSQQIQSMVADIYGGPNGGGNFHAMRAISILKDNDNIDDFYDIDDFYEFTYHNSVILFAMFSLQTRLQAAVCSCSYWDKISEKRYRTFYGYSSIAEILRWGEYADNSVASATGTNAAQRKISTCSFTSQKFVLDVFRPPGDQDSVQCAQSSQHGGHNKSTSVGEAGGKGVSRKGLPAFDAYSCFNPTFTAYSAQYRRNSKSKGVVGGRHSGIDENRRRSFDVTVIIRESNDKGSFMEKQGLVVGAERENRRHSIVT